MSPLIAYATTIRLSMYDWENGPNGSLCGTLKRIEGLRRRIDREGSALKIGASALTSAGRADRLKGLVERLRDAGAHWIYFHPLCSKWGLGSPILAEQDGVLSMLERLRSEGIGRNDVYFFRERYQETDLEFDGYHAARFLLVIGADGLNPLTMR